jgi:hypothetical protein
MTKNNQQVKMKMTTRSNGKNGAKSLPHDGARLESLLDVHRLHHGIFARVAQTLSVDPSYVSRVANGKRRSPEIEQALARELRRISARS